MAEQTKRKEARDTEESVITSVAKSVGSALGAIAVKAEGLVGNQENTPGKKSSLKPAPKSQSPQKAHAHAVKKSKKAKHNRKLGRRTKG